MGYYVGLETVARQNLLVSAGVYLYLFLPLLCFTFLLFTTPTNFFPVSSSLHTIPLFDLVSTILISILHSLGLVPLHLLDISL